MTANDLNNPQPAHPISFRSNRQTDRSLDSHFKRCRNFFDLVLFKAIARLRKEMSKYYLNFLWWIFEPILMMMVFYFVFGVFMHRGTHDFIAFLLIGLVPWNWFSKSVEGSANSILDGAGLMLLVNIHKTFFPLEHLLQDAIKQMIVFTILLVFLFFYLGGCGITWTILPLIIIIQTVLNVAVSFLFAAAVPFFPDLRFIISTGVRLMFFGSGIFYDVERFVSSKYQSILYLNPMAGIIKAYRDILLYDKWPDWTYLMKVFFGGFMLLIFAVWLISSLNYVYPKVCQR